MKDLIFRNKDKKSIFLKGPSMKYFKISDIGYRVIHFNPQNLFGGNPFQPPKLIWCAHISLGYHSTLGGSVLQHENVINKA